MGNNDIKEKIPKFIKDVERLMSSGNICKQNLIIMLDEDE